MVSLEQIETASTNYIPDFCNEWGVEKFSIVEDGHANYDAYFLLNMRKNKPCSLLDIAQMKRRLTEQFGAPVSLITMCAVSQDMNENRRQAILNSSRQLYPAV